MKKIVGKKSLLLVVGTFLIGMFLITDAGYAVVGAVEVVAGKEGKPVPETTISIFQQGALIKEEKADHNGMALIPLEAGDYKIVLESPDKSIKGLINIEPRNLICISVIFE